MCRNSVSLVIKPTNGKHEKKKEIKPSKDPAFIFRVEDHELAWLLSAFISTEMGEQQRTLALILGCS